MINFVVNFKMMDTIKILSGLFHEFFGHAPVSVVALPQAGSDRRYWRLYGFGITAIGCYGPDRVENRCFIGLTNAFRSACLNSVPQIYAVAEDNMHYLQEDLGGTSLFDMIMNREPRDLIEDDMIEKTLRELVTLQKTPSEYWERECKERPFSKRQIFWDLNYFKYEYLKTSGVSFDEERLEDDFEQLSERLLAIYALEPGFMMRDCQSRNVMLTERGPVFIDYQGGRRGPALYDAVSFLWQARAGFSPEFRRKMLRLYADFYCSGDSNRTGRMLAGTDDMVIFRTLQVLGAYGFRGLVQHRAHFLISIPGAICNLKELLDSGSLGMYPELEKVCEKLCQDSRFNGSRKTLSPKSSLRVEIFSFSYKKGYPQDLSGNGGGFMFDCRAMHNPGRYERYRKLTGKDRPVMDFLEERGEVQNFLHAVWMMTDAAVERYLQRGFSNIQIGFGCTGGQHRSVYCADRTAWHLHRLFPEVEIVLTHSEHPA